MTDYAADAQLAAAYYRRARAAALAGDRAQWAECLERAESIYERIEAELEGRNGKVQKTSDHC